jgi:1-acyl-sn-glycerol-3-phosphate acyltransferase
MIVRILILCLFYVACLAAMAVLLFGCRLARVRRPLLRASSWAMGVSRAILGLKVRVDGLERLQGGRPTVYMANHASFIDGPVLFRFPILGWAMRYVGFVPVARRGGGRAGIEKAAARMRSRGDSFLVFPEGTRTSDGRLQPFRRGGLFLAAAAGAPVVPVSIDGTFRLMPRGRIVPRRGTVWVTFHPAVDPAELTPEALPAVLNRVRDAVASGMKGEANERTHDRWPAGPSDG